MARVATPKKPVKNIKATSYHHGNLKPELVKAGLSILVKEGAAHLSLREVARRAGVSHAAPYRHFKDKADLIAAIAEDGFSRLALTIKETMASGNGAVPDQIERLGLAYVRFAAANPDDMIVMFSDTIKEFKAHAGLEQIAYHLLGVVQSIFERGQKEGVIKKGDAWVQAHTYWATMHGLSMLVVGKRSFLHEKTPSQLDELVVSMTEILMKGMGK